MVIDHAEFDHENTLLRVRFGDGHETSYNVQDLELEARAPAEIGIQQRDIQMPTPILWRDEQPKRYAFADLVDESTLEVEELGRTYMDWEDYRIPVTSARNMFELTERLLTHGHVIVTGVPSRHMMVSAFAQCVTRFQGYSSVRATNWGPVFNVQSKPDANLHDLAYTSHALPPHVDNPYRDPNPGFQLLHALENKCFKTGGSIAVDGFEVARQLQEEDPSFSVSSVRYRAGGKTMAVTAQPHLSSLVRIFRRTRAQVKWNKSGIQRNQVGILLRWLIPMTWTFCSVLEDDLLNYSMQKVTLPGSV